MTLEKASNNMMKIGNHDFNTARNCYVMGILNCTPDSFSDGGRWNELDRALSHAEDMIREGAAILDLGGESTRPGYTQISDQEEIDRVVPVIEAVKARFDIPVSVDTYKSGVAAAALQAGADMVNDIWGLQYDPEMAALIAARRVPCCLMHNRKDAVYQDFPAELRGGLLASVALAKAAGIPDSSIILDPGVGFAKSYQQNLAVIHRLDQTVRLGYPVLLGTSRKSCIGLALDLPASERLEGTLVTTVFAVLHGASFVRVHDVKENVRAVKMAQAILREGDCADGL